MIAAEEAARLRAENAALRAENAALRAENARLRCEQAALGEQVTGALERLAELEQSRQPRRRRGARKQTRRAGEPRRARAAAQNAGRRREEPTAFVTHGYERCPDCGYGLRGGQVAYRRQVVDLAEPPPPVVTEHTFVRRWCPACAAWRTPPLPAGLVVGRGRLGVGLASLVAMLRTQLRLPLAQIQAYLEAVHGLRVSRGGLVDLLRRVHRACRPAVAALLAQARASPILYSDETGWREDGRHGYIWQLTTDGPEPVVYLEWDRSRAGAVVERLLGGQFSGTLVSDFYSAYNGYAGKHQRCWAHLLRDLHQLKERHPEQWAVRAWAGAVRRLYTWAQAQLRAPAPPTPAQRQAAYDRLVGLSHRLGLRYAQTTGHPCRALAKRLLRHEAELFRFVLVPGLAADNNLSERRLRPTVVARKISGGSRAEEGTAVRMGLTSLVATWLARGQQPLAACRALLAQATPARALP
jgi:transposase